MSKRKRSGRTKSQAQLHAEAAERREAHTRLVLSREGDPNYVQMTRTDTGREISFGGTEKDAEIREALQNQLQRFRDKFGREPGPEDPLFFNPDKDEPTFMDPEKGRADYYAEVHAAFAKAGLDPAIADAWEELDYIVTESNQHTFTAMEVQAWEEAVERARGNA